MNMNLVTMAYYARRAIAILIALIILIILYFTLKPIVLNGYTALFPPKDPPTITYGKLPAINFVEKQYTGKPSITLNTTNGRLPNGFNNKAVVFRYESIPLSFESGKSAQRNAAYLGFDDNELITDLKDKVYRWRDSETGGILEIDIDTKYMALQTPLLGKDTQFGPGDLTTSSVQTRAKKELAALNKLVSKTYSREEGTITYGTIKDGEILLTNNSFEAQLARVDFFRKVNVYPALGPDASKSLVSITLKKSDRNDVAALRVPFLEVRERSIVEDTSATYPIITVQEAWNEVENGNGIISSIIPSDKSIFSPHKSVRLEEILINEIYLAYYDSTNVEQPYMQPIYVFEGQYNPNSQPGGDITIYFPAIQGQHVQEVEEN